MIRKLVVANLALLAILLATAIVDALPRGGLTVVAQSVLSSLQIIATNPTLGSDPNDRRAVDFSCSTDGSNLNPNFSNASCFQLSQTSSNGNNTNGGLTTAKTTYDPLAINTNHSGAGQRINMINKANCYGMGDCFSSNIGVTYAGGPVNGDEGQGFQSFSALQQQPLLDKGTISSVTRTTCNTTATQSITGAFTVQTVTVASTTGCNVNDWIVVGQEVANGSPNSEAVQITAVGAGTISGAFLNNHNTSVTITPALVMNIALTSGNLGQQRVMVNTSTATTYSTGTVSSITGGSFTGSGTTWANNVVGGTSLNIGCVALAADDYNAAPFNGSGANGTLKSWYQITSVSSATALGIFSFSTAGDMSYHGKGPGSGSYIIRPCVSILKISGSTAVAETTSTTWTAGDTIEVAISPYPDVTGYQYSLAKYGPGGQAEGFMEVRNTGARTFSYGINFDGTMAAGSNADTVPFDTVYQSNGNNTALRAVRSKVQAILLGAHFGDSGATDNAGKIAWDGTGWSIAPNSTTEGLEIQMTTVGAGGKLAAKSPGQIGTGNVAYAQYSGLMGTTVTTFSNLPTCASALEGLEMAITDGSSATFGATLSGGGSSHVKAYCTGASGNWTVH